MVPVELDDVSVGDAADNIELDELVPDDPVKQVDIEPVTADGSELNGDLGEIELDELVLDGDLDEIEPDDSAELVDAGSIEFDDVSVGDGADNIELDELVHDDPVKQVDIEPVTADGSELNGDLGEIELDESAELGDVVPVEFDDVSVGDGADNIELDELVHDDSAEQVEGEPVTAEGREPEGGIVEIDIDELELDEGIIEIELDELALDESAELAVLDPIGLDGLVQGHPPELPKLEVPKGETSILDDNLGMSEVGSGSEAGEPIGAEPPTGSGILVDVDSDIVELVHLAVDAELPEVTQTPDARLNFEDNSEQVVAANRDAESPTLSAAVSSNASELDEFDSGFVIDDIEFDELDLDESGEVLEPISLDDLDIITLDRPKSDDSSAGGSNDGLATAKSTLQALLGELRNNPEGVNKQQLVDAAKAADAIDHLLEEVENLADDVDDERVCSMLWGWRADWLLGLRDEPKRAIMSAQIALRYTPDSLEARLILEEALAALGRWSDLLDSLRYRIGSGTKDAELLQRAAVLAFDRLGEFELAIELAEVWALLDPSELNAWRLAERAAIAAGSTEATLRIRMAMHPYLDGKERAFSAWNLGLALLDEFDRPADAQAYLELACEERFQGRDSRRSKDATD